MASNFESAFKAIDNILRHDEGCSTALDYVEQSSWVLFLKYWDDLETRRETSAMLQGKTYERIIKDKFAWNSWAMPLGSDGKYDAKKALVGDDLVDFVHDLIPVQKAIKENSEISDDIHATVWYKL
jgi:type I restriction enzyme M protein